MRRPRLAQVHAAYLPDVPLEQLCAMTLGTEQAETARQQGAVARRIRREAETRLTWRQTQAQVRERQQTPEQLQAAAEELLR
ncbi:hypothetical protein [Deinococcus aquatilis]|uniref:hypothetical protein n=1 Tax=Deinococcus aquatilis TaxID=519440 RepID=UPI000A07AC84|nr:hypothetical protein [Deinococcus aquatilis]